MPETYPYRRRYTGVATAGAEYTITGDEVPEGRVVRLTNMAILNVTGDATLVKVGVVQGTMNHWLDGSASIKASGVDGFDMDVLLYEGDAPVMKVTPNAASDVHHLYVNGEWWFVGQAGELPV